MSEHLAGSPLFGIVDAGFEGLVGVLVHHGFQSFHEGESIGQRPRKSTVDVGTDLPNLPPISFHFHITMGDLSITDDDCLPIFLQS